MQKIANTQNKMAYKPINKLILQMSAPPLISMFLQYSYNLVDSMFVAKISEQALNYNTHERSVYLDRRWC